MTYGKTLTVLNTANYNKEFEPGSWPLDPDLIKFVSEYIDGFRRVLEDITVDELIKNPQIVLDKFDEYFK